MGNKQTVSKKEDNSIKQHKPNNTANNNITLPSLINDHVCKQLINLPFGKPIFTEQGKQYKCGEKRPNMAHREVVLGHGHGDLTYDDFKSSQLIYSVPGIVNLTYKSGAFQIEFYKKLSEVKDLNVFLSLSQFLYDIKDTRNYLNMHFYNQGAYNLDNANFLNHFINSLQPARYRALKIGYDEKKNKMQEWFNIMNDPILLFNFIVPNHSSIPCMNNCLDYCYQIVKLKTCRDQYVLCQVTQENGRINWSIGLPGGVRQMGEHLNTTVKREFGKKVYIDEGDDININRTSAQIDDKSDVINNVVDGKTDIDNQVVTDVGSNDDKLNDGKLNYEFNKLFRERLVSAPNRLIATVDEINVGYFKSNVMNHYWCKTIRWEHKELPKLNPCGDAIWVGWISERDIKTANYKSLVVQLSDSGLPIGIGLDATLQKFILPYAFKLKGDVTTSLISSTDELNDLRDNNDIVDSSDNIKIYYF